MESSKRHRVLVVDDEDSSRRFAERVLAGSGYDVVSASDGPQALRLVAEQPPFDLFVIDVMMPDMRGDELARRLRAIQPDAKVLYYTGYSDRLFEYHPILGENEAFVDKPVTLNGLREAVSLLLFGRTEQ
jgi:CheY-like chemotaxis protein